MDWRVEGDYIEATSAYQKDGVPFIYRVMESGHCRARLETAKELLSGPYFTDTARDAMAYAEDIEAGEFERQGKPAEPEPGELRLKAIELEIDRRRAEKPACKTCRFWQPIRCAHSRLGVCRRHTPAHSNEPPWPETYENDWCGEYESREQA